MRLRPMAIPMAATLALVLVTPVFAKGPSHDPVPDASYHYDAGEVCSYPITIDAYGNAHALTFDTRQLIAGRTRAKVTNESTGALIDANISGPGEFIFHDDGSLSASGGGPWLIWTFASDEPGAGMWLTTGRITFEVAPDGSLGSLVVRGTRTDVCALLG